MMTKWRKEPLPPLKELATAHPVQRRRGQKKEQTGGSEESEKGKKHLNKWKNKEAAKKKKSRKKAAKLAAEASRLDKEGVAATSTTASNGTRFLQNDTEKDKLKTAHAGDGELDERGRGKEEEDEQGDGEEDDDEDGEEESEQGGVESGIGEEEEGQIAEGDNEGEGTVMVVAKDPELDTINRNVTFFFRGGILHGVDCKRKGTWVRRAAFEAFSEIPNAKITATEDLQKFSDEQTGLIDPSVTERQRRQARVPNYSAHQYVRELRESQYCLHLRGDTSTSRRIYDALAAGCVPVIISDDSHLPFKSQIDWDSFTVSINEDELIEHKSRVPQALIENPAVLRQKQEALRKAQEDLLYGMGSPFDPPNPRFKSNVASHLLQEAFELVPVVGRYRRFPDTFSGCTLVQTLWPDR